MKRYLPLNDKELALRFPQGVVRSNFASEMRAQIGSTTVQFVGPTYQIRFSGVDLSGKAWSVTSDAMPGGGLYSADLDHNGIVDLIYASYTSGNGLAPPMQVLTVLFDGSGRPVPSELDGYFEIDAHGLKDLVDLDGDGRAELVRQAYDDGYWITSLYEARDVHWHRITGQHALRTFPIYTRFTNRANHVPTTPGGGRHPAEDDLSNDVTMYSGNIDSIRWANIEGSEDPELTLSNGTVCMPVAWYSTTVVVMDGANGRVAATLGASKDAHTLLDAIQKSKLMVQIKGKRRDRGAGGDVLRPKSCIPETVWASGQGDSP